MASIDGHCATDKVSTAALNLTWGLENGDKFEIGLLFTAVH